METGIVLATGNKGKIREFSEAFHLSIDCVPVKAVISAGGAWRNWRNLGGKCSG